MTNFRFRWLSLFYYTDTLCQEDLLLEMKFSYMLVGKAKGGTVRQQIYNLHVKFAR